MGEEKQEKIEGEKYKLTLNSGKVVTIRELTIDDQRDAARDAGSVAGADNQMLAGIELQRALTKLLVVRVNGKVLSGTQKEQLKEVFSFQEYAQVTKFVQELMGKDEPPKVEFI